MIENILVRIEHFVSLKALWGLLTLTPSVVSSLRSSIQISQQSRRSGGLSAQQSINRASFHGDDRIANEILSSV